MSLMRLRGNRGAPRWAVPYLMAGAVALVSLWIAEDVFAQAFPVDHRESVEQTVDRSSIPANWRFREPLQVHYTPGDIRGSRTAYVCRSDTDSATGACAVRPSWDTSTVRTRIRLRFVESRTHHAVDLVVTGAKIVTVNGSTCIHVRRQLHDSSNNGTCSGRPYDVSRYDLSLSREEMAKVPMAGIWRAQLMLDVIELGHAARSAAHVYDITLNVTDRNNAQIYFPTLATLNPRVAFDLRSRPGAGFVPVIFGGRALDLCFYDGFGSNSDGALRVRATGPGGRFPEQPAGYASIAARGTPGQFPADRIDYRVGLTYDGATQWLRIGDAAGMAFSPTSQSPIRLVRLPGIPVPVACTPARLNFEIAPFVVTTKRHGEYEGTLRLEMTVDAGRI